MIALVVGHDSIKKGAKGKAGVYEFDYNKHLVNQLSEILTTLNVENKVFYRNPFLRGYTRKMIDLHNRIKINDAKIAIEFHFNSFFKASTHGHEVVYCGAKEEAKTFNKYLNKLPNRDRGIKKVSIKERGGSFLCRGKYPCLIVEPFFASEQKYYMYDEQGYQDLLGIYVDAITELNAYLQT